MRGEVFRLRALRSEEERQFVRRALLELRVRVERRDVDTIRWVREAVDLSFEPLARRLDSERRPSPIAVDQWLSRLERAFDSGAM